ncbi:MAG TPA: nucleotidyl transferase AbiEii/AbiGii toxin family protein [Candidatus Nanoarchaeia archaeon]|nr:nucleotidyl transferase AbiEii/AbiGii toxin family protein [Candidatus Nanoarchaeia archaeon]
MKLIIQQLKKQAHRDIARAQDIIVEVLFSLITPAVMHGGTAIWRCYQGNRFSEDIDVYLPKDCPKLNEFFQKLQQLGFRIEKKKIGEKSLFSQLTLNRVAVRFEAVWKTVDGILGDYSTAEGNIIPIYTLSPEDLIKEKAQAYLKRWKIRDLYDIIILLRAVKDPAKVRPDLQRLTMAFQKPVDEPELAILILEGLVPSSQKMIDYIKRWP